MPPTTTPTTPPTTRGAVLFLHGFAQNHRSWHAAGHRSLLCFAAAAGFDVFALDMRSAACRALGAAPAQGTWQLATDDVPQALRVVGAVSAHQRAFVVGHSLGGLVACAAAGRHPELVAGVVPVAGAYHFGRAWFGSGQPWVVRALWRGGLAVFRAVFDSGLVPRRGLAPTRLLGRAGGVLGWAMSHALPLPGWAARNLARLMPASLQISLPGAFPPGPEAALLRSFCAESFEDMPLGTANDLVAMASRTAAGKGGRSLMAFDGRPKPKPAPAPAAVGAAAAAAAADSADHRAAGAAGAAAPAAAAAAAAAADTPADDGSAAGAAAATTECSDGLAAFEAQVEVPLFVLCARDDGLAHWQDSLECFGRSASKDKQFLVLGRCGTGAGDGDESEGAGGGGGGGGSFDCDAARTAKYPRALLPADQQPAPGWQEQRFGHLDILLGERAPSSSWLALLHWLGERAPAVPMAAAGGVACPDQAQRSAQHSPHHRL